MIEQLILEEWEQMMLGKTKLLIRSQDVNKVEEFILGKRRNISTDTHKRKERLCKIEIGLWSETGTMENYIACGDLCKIWKESRATFYL